ncbi:MAG: cation:proton antiporter [Actinophytocola sp.]|uniref:cation:proton antiporter domain-containing protein n=1 Tax=Actinophytocola sp. TaxID=1872138 RepID=UPI003C74D245
MSAAAANVQALLSVGAVVVSVRTVGWLIAKVGQPRVMGEIIAGILLGPSVLGLFWPEAFGFLFPDGVIGALKVLAQFGLTLFMFLIGIELNLRSLRGQGRRAVAISQASIVVPMLLGAALALWLYPAYGAGVDRLAFVLFIGAAMSITAFPVLARLLQETGLIRTRTGVLAMTCAAIDDVTAWCLLAVVVATTSSSGMWDAAATIGLAVVYVLVMLKVIAPLLTRFERVPLWAVLVLLLVSAWTTEQIGIHAIFGGFLAGVVMPRREPWRQEVHDRLETTVTYLLLPVFFVVVGLGTRVDLLTSPALWGVTALVIVVAVAGKFGGAALAARAAGETWQSSATIGLLMNTRGLTEIVILTVGLELGVITPTLFTIMLLMALVTTLMAAPLLRLVPQPREVLAA